MNKAQKTLNQTAAWFTANPTLWYQGPGSLLKKTAKDSARSSCVVLKMDQIARQRWPQEYAQISTDAVELLSNHLGLSPARGGSDLMRWNDSLTDVQVLIDNLKEAANHEL